MCFGCREAPRIAKTRQETENEIPMAVTTLGSQERVPLTAP